MQTGGPFYVNSNARHLTLEDPFIVSLMKCYILMQSMCFTLYIWFQIQESSYGHKKEKEVLCLRTKVFTGTCSSWKVCKFLKTRGMDPDLYEYSFTVKAWSFFYKYGSRTLLFAPSMFRIKNFLFKYYIIYGIVRSESCANNESIPGITWSRIQTLIMLCNVKTWGYTVKCPYFGHLFDFATFFHSQKNFCGHYLLHTKLVWRSALGT